MPRYYDHEDEWAVAPGASDPQLMRARRVIRYLLATRALSPGDRDAASSAPGSGRVDAERGDGVDVPSSPFG